MLNPFPILFLSMLAHFLLRVTVGGLLLHLGVTHLAHRHDLKHTLTMRFFPYGLFAACWLGIAEIVLSVMFVFGFYTQIAALVTIVYAVKVLVFRRQFASPYIPGPLFFILLLAASLSLFITGAGAFAFDLPI